MKITIESTSQVVEIMTESGFTVPGRIWVGKTNSGIDVQCLVTRIAVPQSENLEQFERELKECRPPESAPIAFPLRMVI